MARKAKVKQIPSTVVERKPRYVVVTDCHHQASLDAIDQLCSNAGIEPDQVVYDQSDPFASKEEALHFIEEVYDSGVVGVQVIDSGSNSRKIIENNVRILASRYHSAKKASSVKNRKGGTIGCLHCKSRFSRAYYQSTLVDSEIEACPICGYELRSPKSSDYRQAMKLKNELNSEKKKLTGDGSQLVWVLVALTDKTED